MSSALLWLAAYAVNAIWQVTALAAVAWIVCRCVHRAGPGIQHRVWVSALIAATLVPATPIIESLVAWHAITGDLSVSPPVMAGAVGARGFSPGDGTILFQAITIYVVCLSYAAVVLFFLLRLCRAVYGTARLVRHAVRGTETSGAELWQKAKDAFSVQTVELRYSRCVAGPATAGFRHPVLILPHGFVENHSPSEFLAAAGHECAHIKRNDFRKNLFYEVLALFTSFHPATWFIKSRIAETREMICDETAADQLLGRRAYALALLQLAGTLSRNSPSEEAHALGMFETNDLERRVMTLTTSEPRVNGRRRYVSGLAAAAVLTICAGISGSLTKSVAAQPGTAASSRGTDLSCTYYDENTRGHAGACGVDKKDAKQYRCYLLEDPSRSQVQVGCESKVLRAAGKQKGERRK